jgi:hypothetical protein
LLAVEKAAKFLVLGDQRGEGRYMRASWHAESRSIVLSHWSDDVCTASSRLALADAPRLIGFIVDALHHAATVPVPVPATAPAPAPGARPSVIRFAEGVGTWLRRRWAPVAPVISLAGHKKAGVAGGPEDTTAAPSAQTFAPWSERKNAGHR